MNEPRVNYQLIVSLIEEVERFQQVKPDGDHSLESFALWLNQRVLTGQPKNSKAARSIAPVHQQEVKKGDYHTSPINVQVTLLLHMLSRHFKLYSKKVLHDSDLVSMEGHTFLSALYHTDSMRKMELIRAHYMEVPSGIEVIKRLLKKGFIEEFDDPHDKRAKQVKITAAGRQAFEATLPDMKKVIELMSGDLSDQKKIDLVGILDELNDHHNARHDQVKKLSLDQLLDHKVDDV